MMRKLALSSVVVCSLLGPLGCSGSTATADPTAGATTAQTGTRVAAVAPSAKSSRVRTMAEALSNVPLRDDERAEIEKLASDADARHLSAAGARSDIMLALAAQIEAGQLDRPALQAKIDAAADAANAGHPADQAAIQRLHALLTPEQRGQVADALVSRHKAMRAEHPDHHSRIDQWAADLKLTDAQRAQIMAVFAAQKAEHMAEHGADFKAMHEHGGGFAESFRGDTLQLPPPQDARVHANAMADHFVSIAQAILPILTPEQRSLAAAKLRERAAAGAANEDAPLSE
jgi:Spy/CpxP family protein refolding chaperone